MTLNKGDKCNADTTTGMTERFEHIVRALIIPIVGTLIIFKKYSKSIYTYTSLVLTAIMTTAVITVAIGLLNAENKPDYGLRCEGSTGV